MGKFILEADNLILQLNYFTLAVDELGLFVLQVEGFVVDKLVQVIDSGQLLGDIVLEGSGLGSQVRALLALEFVLVAELVDFLGVLSVSLPEVLKLVLEVLLLGEQLRVEILVLT